MLSGLLLDEQLRANYSCNKVAGTQWLSSSICVPRRLRVCRSGFISSGDFKLARQRSVTIFRYFDSYLVWTVFSSSCSSQFQLFLDPQVLDLLRIMKLVFFAAVDAAALQLSHTGKLGGMPDPSDPRDPPKRTRYWMQSPIDNEYAKVVESWVKDYSNLYTDNPAVSEEPKALFAGVPCACNVLPVLIYSDSVLVRNC